MKTLKSIAIHIVLILIITAYFPEAIPTSPMTSVTVHLGWTPQANPPGFYDADRLGYYAAEGLAVSFIEGGANISNPSPVLDGTAQFGVTGADDLILKRAQGQRVRALATIYRRSPVAYISLADSGIARPQDFVGKTIRVAPNLITSLHAMMTLVKTGEAGNHGYET